jgi:hypothetical protein
MAGDDECALEGSDARHAITLNPKTQDGPTDPVFIVSSCRTATKRSRKNRQFSLKVLAASRGWQHLLEETEGSVMVAGGFRVFSPHLSRS